MTPRITTSGPDQADRRGETAWQRERAGGRLIPLHDENGQPWTVLRCARILAGFALLFAAAWVAMWVTA